MSRIADIDATTDFYELNCDNCTQENALANELISTASQFQITLQQSLDLSPLIYLRSVDAEISLKHIHVGSLPLTFTSSEEIEILLTFIPEITACNQEVHKTTITGSEGIKGRNEIPLKLPISDFIASTPKEAIAYVNSLLEFKINFFLLARYFELFLDKKVLNDVPEGYPTNEDYKLLFSYFNAAMYARHSQHAVFCQYLGITDNISTNRKFLGKGKVISAAEETEILKASKCIIPTTLRAEFTNQKTLTMADFYTKNVTNVSETIDASIKTKVDTWLTAAHFQLNPITEKSKKDLQNIFNANKHLIEVGLVLLELLKLEKERADKRVKQGSRLFQSEFLFLQMDLTQQRCSFFFQSDGYIPLKANLNIYFPKKMSYTLGADIDHYVKIGPITHIPKTNGPKLSNSIDFSSQRLPNAIRNLPTLLYVCSDLTTGKGQDTFLSTTIFSKFHIMYTYLFDDTSFRARAIVSTDCNSDYAKIKQTFKLLEQFEVCLLDENLQKVLFAPRTFTRLSFQIRPSGLS
jgi:hypothetical protein